MKDYSKIGWQYSKDVASGKQIASKYLKLQVKKCLRDLNDKDAPMVYRPEWANHYCNFIETYCTHVKDKIAGTPFILEPWQIHQYCMTYGWRDRGREDKRFYKDILILCARKQGKTIAIGAQSLYHLIYEGQNAQIKSMAVQEEQSKYCWRDARSMIMNSKKLQKLIDITPSKRSIKNKKTEAEFVHLKRGIPNLNGMSPNCIWFDEASEFTDAKMFTEITSGQGSIYDPINVYFSTASHLLDGPYHEKLNLAMKRLEGEGNPHKRELALIYQIDAGDDPFLESNWPKAAPNIGVSQTWDDMREWSEDAQSGNSAALDAFLIKKVCRFVQSESKWVATRLFKDNLIEKDDFDARVKGLECVIGVDLSVRFDLTAIGFNFYDPDTGDYYYTHKTFLPKVSLKNIPKTYSTIYRDAIDNGFLILVDTEVIDVVMITEYLKDMITKYNVKSINVDPNLATELINIMSKEETEIKVIVPRMQFQSQYISQMERKVGLGKIHILNEKLLLHQLDNVMIHVNTNGQKKIVNSHNKNKRNPNNKIDSIDAMLNTFSEPTFLSGEAEYDDHISIADAY